MSGTGWGALTRLQEKERAYRADPLTRSAMAVADGCGGDLAARLWDLALVVVKPEALVSGRLAAVRRFLAAHGLSAVSSFDTELDAARSHALWSYPWVKATSDRVRLHVLMSEREPSRCLLVRREVPGGDVPLTMWVAERKGSSNAGLRRAGQLRTELGMANRMIAFVHCPDEPADLLRDVYVLGGAPAVELLLALPATGGGTGPWSSAAPSDPVSLDLSTLLDGLTPRGRERMRSRLAARREHGEVVGLDEALREVREWGARDRWTECALAAELIPHDLPGVTTAFDRLSVDRLADLWRASPGVPVDAVRDAGRVS
ncbi:hypothetical protein [Saccharothrix algeriensis]|uniref:Nucleoside diphosphate kinase-like domain-containing protein n=1 Tax=Saccharothrix algeriensis TaxID=173560 RepID=A0A8T8HWJ9_9PSEU|nr:hypothetical protein [Saccharothrix algeriensis]MBM7814452.1 hypothetical protein [Saccharothrix algeriensis]QTR02751.1 hypothetical protein J7S33_27535 [Saccharothrix algeriensis]